MTTIYKFTTADDGKVTVKDGGTTHLEFFPGQEGNTGLEAAIHEDMGSVGWNKTRGRWTWENNDTKFAMQCAAWCIKKTRASLPFGTFNNTMVLDGKRQYLTPKKTLGTPAKEKQLSPKFLVDAAERFAEQFKDYTLPIQLAARGHGTRLVQGGVCSLVSHVCLGFITQSIPSDGEAAVVYHSADHSFCVLRYKTSPWIVVDPWPMRSYVIPWEQCGFGYTGLNNNFRVKILKKVETPYGVAIPKKADDPVLASANGAEDELALGWDVVSEAITVAGIKVASAYTTQYSRTPTDIDKDFKDGDDHIKYWNDGNDPNAACPCGAKAAGIPAILKNCPNFTNGENLHKRGNFHFGHVWLHPDNLRWPSRRQRCTTSRVDARSPYGAVICSRQNCCFKGDSDMLAGHMDDMKPVVGPDCWGDPKNWKAVKTLREYADANE